MTILDKNIAIAEMLGWTKTGHKHPFTPSLGELYRHKNYSGDYWGEKFKYNSDANWQFEAINFIKSKGYTYAMAGNFKRVSFVIHCSELKAIVSQDSKEIKAIFEALYQFSQYLKQKK